ncbi:hypothetical protein Zmor_021332 [Zophobas morio]|uniref:Uncharacterized protein n=1 Tax=Zophobas morio TaxID=2755281 RepID=A0AA38MAM4_9CUCU|nr:hypothetical protein Zmor_021332 [Zophobas morio]
MVEKKIHVTRSSLLDCLKKKHIFEGSLSSLGRILHSLLGFVILQQVYRSVLWNYMLFMQKHTSYVNTCTISRTQILCHVILMKHGYLKMDVQNRREKYIVFHVGTSNGFIDEAALVFSSNTKNPDYHGEMNQQNFLK